MSNLDLNFGNIFWVHLIDRQIKLMVTTLGYCWKKSEQGVVTDTLFWRNPWRSQICHFTPGDSRENKLSTLEILQNCVRHPLAWKFQKPILVSSRVSSPPAWRKKNSPTPPLDPQDLHPPLKWNFSSIATFKT